MKKLAVCPGSFDPVTLGHVDLARRAAKIFGACRVVVMNNREKTYLFSLEERLELCKAAFAEDENITVDASEGMLYEYLGTLDEPILVKGVRNETDYLYEKNMARFNFEHGGVETLYLDSSEDLVEVSSTVVRERLKNKEDLSDVLPPNVVKLLQNKM